jgi:hypothetical protein
LRQYAGSLALNPAFTVLDRADSADLMDVVRSLRPLKSFYNVRSKTPKMLRKPKRHNG